MTLRTHALVRAAVLLPLIVFSVSSGSWAVFRCRFDGLVRTASCCGTHGARDEGAPARVSAGGCCEREVHTAVRPPSEPPSEREIGAVLVRALPSTRTVLAVRAPVAPVVAADGARAGPSDGGRALVLLKRSFLI